MVSDWGAVRDRVAALRGGLDWEMPGPQARRVKAVVEAVRSGELAEATLDEAVRRILRIVFKAQETPKGGAFDVDAHHGLARKIAAEGMVLLKNDPCRRKGACCRCEATSRSPSSAVPPKPPTSRAAAVRTSTRPGWMCRSRSFSPAPMTPN